MGMHERQLRVMLASDPSARHQERGGGELRARGRACPMVGTGAQLVVRLSKEGTAWSVWGQWDDGSGNAGPTTHRHRWALCRPTGKSRCPLSLDAMKERASAPMLMARS